MNLLSSMVDSSESSRPNLLSPLQRVQDHLLSPTSNVKAADFFPGSFGATGSKEDTINKTVLRKRVAGETKNAQLTIFFNGQVVVYNDFPPDKIARRNSLHKFFEKRKDRAAARAPYQSNNNRVSLPPSKPDGNKPSCEEGRSSKDTPRCIDLNL
ncbi:Jasmonate-zim-domain protein 6, putative isoform 2 [Hibiscus syriacus]|uniref:Protein TIFY n=1 Tax=Hibiscus syriacus TaxID=106335 RepID=A0A6A3CNF8_HIBSY|nr:Jasmonate-zim-domain protein 6, putative isoform 2 [Hibiscus syriacus]